MPLSAEVKKKVPKGFCFFFKKKSGQLAFSQIAPSGINHKQLSINSLYFAHVSNPNKTRPKKWVQ